MRFTDAQYAALVCINARAAKEISHHENAGHSDIAPETKSSPGPCFDWVRYRAALKAAG